jgi:hypothetical protein
LKGAENGKNVLLLDLEKDNALLKNEMLSLKKTSEQQKQENENLFSDNRQMKKEITALRNEYQRLILFHSFLYKHNSKNVMNNPYYNALLKKEMTGNPKNQIHFGMMKDSEEMLNSVMNPQQLSSTSGINFSGGNRNFSARRDNGDRRRTRGRHNEQMNKKQSSGSEEENENSESDEDEVEEEIKQATTRTTSKSRYNRVSFEHNNNTDRNSSSLSSFNLFHQEKAKNHSQNPTNFSNYDPDGDRGKKNYSQLYQKNNNHHHHNQTKRKEGETVSAISSAPPELPINRTKKADSAGHARKDSEEKEDDNSSSNLNDLLSNFHDSIVRMTPSLLPLFNKLTNEIEQERFSNLVTNNSNSNNLFFKK